MAEDQTVVTIVTRSIYSHARGDPSALARNIIADLAEAGYEIRKPDEPMPIGRNAGKGSTA